MNLQDQRIGALCEQLKMASVAAEWPALAQDAAREGASFADFLERGLAGEWAARERRKREVLLKLATLPGIKTLEQFDWSAATGAPKAHEPEVSTSERY